MTALETARLRLEPFAASDTEPLHLIRNDPAVMEYWDWPADATVDDTQSVARSLLDDIAAGGIRVWSIRRKDDHAFLGVIDLSGSDTDECDIGFMIRSDCWGQGFASEAATAVMAWAWSEGFVRVTARIHADNVRSRRLLVKLGFASEVVRDVEIRPGVTKACEYFARAKPQGSSSLSQ